VVCVCVLCVVCVVYMWCVCGVYVVCVCGVCGVCVWCVWCICGVCVCGVGQASGGSVPLDYLAFYLALPLGAWLRTAHHPALAGLSLWGESGTNPL